MDRAFMGKESKAYKQAKMKDVKRRIGNHKMRLDLGKGDVDFDGRPGDDDIKDIDYINPIEER